jgi:deoxyhypusine synthase
MQSDYSIVMPFLVKALLENRERYAAMGDAAANEPKAAGYLRDREGYKLFEQREALVANLLDHVAMNRDWLVESLEYPLASLER